MWFSHITSVMGGRVSDFEDWIPRTQVGSITLKHASLSSHFGFRCLVLAEAGKKTQRLLISGDFPSEYLPPMSPFHRTSIPQNRDREWIWDQTIHFENVLDGRVDICCLEHLALRAVKLFLIAMERLCR
jgi:hypothetical protein